MYPSLASMRLRTAPFCGTCCRFVTLQALYPVALIVYYPISSDYIFTLLAYLQYLSVNLKFDICKLGATHSWAFLLIEVTLPSRCTFLMSPLGLAHDYPIIRGLP